MAEKRFLLSKRCVLLFMCILHTFARCWLSHVSTLLLSYYPKTRSLFNSLDSILNIIIFFSRFTREEQRVSVNSANQRRRGIYISSANQQRGSIYSSSADNRVTFNSTTSNEVKTINVVTVESQNGTVTPTDKNSGNENDSDDVAPKDVEDGEEISTDSFYDCSSY